MTQPRPQHWAVVTNSDGTPLTVPFQEWDCHVVMEQYAQGRGLSLRLVDAEDGSSIARATSQLPGMTLPSDEVLIKNYSENAGVLDALTMAGLLTVTGRTVRSGHATLHQARLTPLLADQWERFREDLAAGQNSRQR